MYTDAEVKVEFTEEDMRWLKRAASGCRLEVDEFVRLAVVAQVRGGEAVENQETHCARHRVAA